MITHQTLGIRCALAFSILVGAGCSDDSSGDDEVSGDYNGVRAHCDNATGTNFYYQFHIPCPLGNDIEGCYAAIAPEYINICIGPDNIENFTFDEWSLAERTFPAYDTAIRTHCTAMCNNNHMGGVGGSPYPASCSNTGWSDHGTEETWTPNAGYNCKITSAADPLEVDPHAANIDWSEDGIPLSIPLGCSLASDCAALFDADIDQWTRVQEFGGPPGAIDFDTRYADYLGTDAAATVEVDTAAIHHSLVAQAEYSASECGASTCPFYLANFEASNSDEAGPISISWPLLMSEPTQIENLQIHALSSTMGAWRPSTGQVAFPPGSLILDVRFDVSRSGHHEFSLTNDSVIFGHFNRNGTLALAHSFKVLGGTASFDVQLDASEHPPRAAIALAAQVRCNDPQGYVLSADDSAAIDPDGDLDYEIWVVDGVAEGNGTTLPLGAHTLDLVVVDDRGARDAAGKQPVEVILGPACL